MGLHGGGNNVWSRAIMLDFQHYNPEFETIPYKESHLLNVKTLGVVVRFGKLAVHDEDNGSAGHWCGWGGGKVFCKLLVRKTSGIEGDVHSELLEIDLWVIELWPWNQLTLSCHYLHLLKLWCIFVVAQLLLHYSHCSHELHWGLWSCEWWLIHRQQAQTWPTDCLVTSYSSFCPMGCHCF